MHAIAITSIFSFINIFIRDDIFLGVLNLSTTLLSMITLFDLRKNRNIPRSSFITIFFIVCFFIAFVYINKNDEFGLIWVQLVSIFSVALIGWKKGAVITLVYLFIIFLIAYDGIGVWQDGLWTPMAFTRLIFSSLSVLLIVVMMDIALTQSIQRIKILSEVDVLTNAYNRRKITSILQSEMKQSSRYEDDLALILLDIDDFKKVNDTLGHQEGDRVLQSLSKHIKSSLRSSDSFGRWGGEEFLIIIPQISQENAKKIIEKLRLSINETQTVTCSFGLSIYQDKENMDTFVNRADKAMYQAKKSGKNQVYFLAPDTQ